MINNHEKLKLFESNLCLFVELLVHCDQNLGQTTKPMLDHTLENLLWFMILIVLSVGELSSNL